MSFILDALKKAESERSRHAGPVLMDVRVVSPRQRLPGWAWLLGCVLLANLLVLSWLLLRKPQPAPPVAAVPQQAVTAPVPAPVTPAPPAPAVIEPAPATAPAMTLPPPALASVQTPAAAALPEQLPPPPPPSARPLLPRIDNLPTAQDLVAQGVALPTLTLNLHVYDDAPANRYVLINARRLREGDEVADGIRVETIVPGGVVFNGRGRRFVLLAGS